MRPLPDDHDFDHGPQWFGVRSNYRFIGEFGQNIYEERVVLFLATDATDAVRQAEAEATEYADERMCEVVPMLHAFRLFDEVGPGAEIYSLMRESDLDPEAYIDRYFDSGTERYGD